MKLLLTIPHSGEKVPPEAPWLQGLPETILMYDVDRFVDQLYEPVIKKLGLSTVKTEWHRYSGDLNRLADDVDQGTVLGSPHPKGTFSRGFLWAITTAGYPLMPGPVDSTVHQTLVQKYFEPFHQAVAQAVVELKAQGQKTIYHIDAHSMPSMGTQEHRDPGEMRADFVISDQNGKSCSAEFRDLVVETFRSEGFRVALNWPYVGGRITERYGQPSKGHHSIQVEMNRSLYMDELSKQLLKEKVAPLQVHLETILKGIQAGIQNLG